MEMGLMELFTTNEKMQAIENCRKQLEEEIKSSRERYEELIIEHDELTVQLAQLAQSENLSRQTEFISKLNEDKADLRLRKDMYKDRCNNVDRIARERAEEIKKAKEEILEKVEAQKIVEVELKNLKSDYEYMLVKYNDKQNELNEFATSNKDQTDRILNLETQNKEEEIAYKGKIERMEAEYKKAVELVEKE